MEREPAAAAPRRLARDATLVGCCDERSDDICWCLIGAGIVECRPLPLADATGQSRESRDQLLRQIPVFGTFAGLTTHHRVHEIMKDLFKIERAMQGGVD